MAALPAWAPRGPPVPCRPAAARRSGLGGGEPRRRGRRRARPELKKRAPAIAMAQAYPAGCVIRTLIEAFLPYRGLALAPRGLAAGGAPRAFTDDEVISDMEQFYYVRLDALRAAPRGGRDWVVVLVLSASGKYAQHSPDLRKLLEGVESERAAKERRLDELIVVAEEDFFSKKNLTDVVRDAQARQVGGADPAGAMPFYNAYPYYVFACNLPEVRSIPPHRIMRDEEVDALLRQMLKALTDLPAITASDSPVVWLGGREGQVVEIARDSQTSGISIYYRRVVRGA